MDLISAFLVLFVFLQCFDFNSSQRSSTYCSDDRELPNGYVSYSIGRFYSQTQLVSGVIRRFYCHRGWSVVGATFSECRNGRWSRSTPKCIEDACEPLREDVNNYLTVYYSEEPSSRGKYASGVEAHVYCEDHDSILVAGDGYPVCVRGSWMPQIPLCLHRDLVDESCNMKDVVMPEALIISNPEDIKSGMVNHFGMLRFKCLPGYTLQGSDVTTCLDAEWSRIFPTCEPDEDYEICGKTSGNTQSRSRGTGRGRGRGRSGRQRRMVGGIDANDGSWPWHVAIYWYNVDMWQFICGGTLVDKQWVLTAAHCFQRNENIKNLQIRLGLTHRVRHHDLPREQMHEIDGLYINRYFNWMSFDFDVAMIHLTKPAVLNPFVRTICLPEVDNGNNYDKSLGLVEENVYGMVTGWGHSEVIHFKNHTSGKVFNKRLQQLEVPIKKNQTCVKSLENHGEPVEYFTERMFCAGYTKRSRGPCFGDSGGPVMREISTPVGGVNSTEVTSNWVQIGIVSNTATGCAVTGGVYTFYTHLPKVVQWVYDVFNTEHNPSNHLPYMF